MNAEPQEPIARLRWELTGYDYDGTVIVRRDDLQVALDGLSRLREAAQWLIDELQAPDDEYRLNEADKAMDAIAALLPTPPSQHPACDPTDAGSGESEERS